MINSIVHGNKSVKLKLNKLNYLAILLLEQMGILEPKEEEIVYWEKKIKGGLKQFIINRTHLV